MNKAIIMGRLTRDPELKTTQNNTSVCSITIAVDRRFKNANGERQADFIACTAWRQTAEFIAQHFAKGSQLAVVGSIQTSSWDDSDGKKQYKTEVVIDEVYFTGSKPAEAIGATPSQAQPAAAKQSASRPTYTQDMMEASDIGLPFDL